MIDFEGVDIIVEHEVNDELVRRAIGSVLGIPEHRVTVITDISDYPERDRADVVVVASSAGGQFAQLLSIQVDRRTLPYDNALDLIQRICDQLHTRCLVPDDTPNPFTMWLITRDESPRRVGLVAVSVKTVAA